MAHTLYVGRLITDIQILIARSKELENIKHSGRRGSYREELLGQIIKSYLPFGWDIGSGEVIDSNGNYSSEVDLLIYNKFAIPPLFHTKNNDGTFPLESCQIVFEIKSTSNQENIETTIKKFQNLNQLNIHNDNFYRPIRVYFAYDSDLTKDLSSKRINELERYLKAEERINNHYCDNNPTINVLCIVGQGYWAHQSDETGFRWIFIDSQKDNNELYAFLGSLIKTFNPATPLISYIKNDKCNYIPVYIHDYELGLTLRTKKQIKLYDLMMKEFQESEKSNSEVIEQVNNIISQISSDTLIISGLLYKLGKKAHRNENYEKAILLFDKALKIDRSKKLNNNADLWGRKANSQYRIAQSTQSIDSYHNCIMSFKKVVKLDPSWSEPYAFLAEIYYSLWLKNNKLEELRESANYFDFALSRNPNSFQLLNDSGLIYFDLGKEAKKINSSEDSSRFLCKSKDIFVKAIEKYPTESKFKYYISLIEEELNK